MTDLELKNHRHQPNDGSWWERDAQGFALCRVCDKCRAAKLSIYRPEIRSSGSELRGYSQADVDEDLYGEP